MNLLTVEQVLDELKKRKILITRDNFNYYQKYGLLFAPERKIKRRIKEGIISYFAEEIIDRIKKVYELKEEGFSLSEIKHYLSEQDRNYVLKWFKDVEAYLPITPLSVQDANFKVERWLNEGYYQGQLNLLNELAEKLSIAKAVATQEYDKLDSVRKSLLQAIKIDKDISVIEKVFKTERSMFFKKVKGIDDLLSALDEGRGPLHTFLISNVYIYEIS